MSEVIFDLYSEIRAALQGEERSFRYLASLSSEVWAHHPAALGQFIQTLEPEKRKPMAQILGAAMDKVGRKTIEKYLASSFQTVYFANIATIY